MAEVYNSRLDAFELYHKIQEADRAGPSSEGIGLPALGHALAGSAGTAISHIVLYPLDLVITRLQVQQQLRRPGEAPSAAREAEDAEYTSLQDAARKIYEHEGGLGAFWTGWKEDTAKSIVDSFLFFLAYTALRQRQQARLGSKNLPVLHELGVGVVAGAFSKFITTPIQQIVTRKQTAAMVSARDPSATVPVGQTGRLSIKDIALQIRSEKGIRGFWAGYSASLILTMNPALTFLFQNLIKRILARSRSDNPGPKTLFLIAAVSKAIASTITYPFSLAKSRAQVSTSPNKSAFSSSSSPSPFGDDGEKPTDLSSSTFSYPEEKPTPSLSSRARTAVQTLSPQRHLTRLAVVRSLRTIYRTEGARGLYSGLAADVAKGFLGHGLSMALKERIHVLVIGAYLIVRSRAGGALSAAGVGDAGGSLGKSLGDVGEQASREFRRVTGNAGEVAEAAAEKVQGVAESVVEGVKEAVGKD